jgi:hypothetical protein
VSRPERLRLLRQFQATVLVGALLMLAIGLMDGVRTTIYAAAFAAAVSLSNLVGVQARLAALGAVEQSRPRPDYRLIAALERDIYGEAFEHDGAPRVVRADPEVAEIHQMMDEIVDLATRPWRQK